jgi:hypothetical protein
MWRIFWHQNFENWISGKWVSGESFFWKTIILHILMEEFHNSFNRWPTCAESRRDLHQRKGRGGRAKWWNLEKKNWVKPCYPRYFFDLFMPKKSTLWVILPGAEKFFISWPEGRFWSRFAYQKSFFWCTSTFCYSISYTHDEKVEMHEKDDFWFFFWVKSN